MTTILYNEPELVIALNKKIIFVNPNDLQIFKEIVIPDDLMTCGLKVDDAKSVNNDADGCEKQNQEKKSNLQIETPSIQHVQLSPNRQCLAVTTAGQKALLLYQCRPEHAKLVSVRPLARASSALVFCSDSSKILVTDKTGDCYEYDCVDLKATPRILLGHLSIVYDALWTKDNKYIITCDRDDKIRVTNYPETYDIHGYCLGHTEFVSGLAFLQDEIIASVSGDKTMRLWNFLNGKQLLEHKLPAPGIRLAIRKVDEKKFQAAVLLHQPEECVGIYEIEQSSDEWTIKEVKFLKFPSSICCNLCFVNKRIYITGIVEHFKLNVISLENDSSLSSDWLQMVDEQFKLEPWIPEDVSAWFKKRYDNVSEYLERKKRRIEEKQK